LVNQQTIAPGAVVQGKAVAGTGSTDDTAAFYAAIMAGDVLVKAGKYRINGYDSSPAPDGRAMGGIPLPSNRNIRCEAGAVLINPHTASATAWVNGHTNVFRITGQKNDSIIGCSFAGTNTTGVSSYNANQEFDQGVWIENGSSYVQVSGNDFSNFWGNCGFETYQYAPTYAPNHITFSYNTGQHNGIYGWCDDGATDSYFGYNYVLDSASGTELDNSTQISQRNVYENNITKSDGFVRYDAATGNGAGYFGAAQIKGIDYSTDVFRNNQVTGLNTFLYMNHDTTAMQPQYSNNTCLNGCAMK